jgi:hypothetical protein
MTMTRRAGAGTDHAAGGANTETTPYESDV